MKKRSIWYWFIPALLVFAAGLLAAAMWDMPIDVALYSPRNPFAIFMEAFGWWPAFLPAAFYAMILATRPKSLRRPGWQRAAAILVLVAGLAAIYYMSFNYLRKRGWVTPGSPAAWALLAGGVLLAALGLVAATRLSPPMRARLSFFGLSAGVYMLANQAVVYTVKSLWQRTRFDDMVLAGSFLDFTPWYQPFGPGGSSFPSGHTANAAGIFALIILCDLFPAWNRRRKLVYVLCWGYVALMAFNRILIGRHFLSDTLAAAGIMALLFFILRSTKFYQNGLRKAKAEAARLANTPGGNNDI